eukprot:TRINITY_DN8663_c0_g1_i1.p1 TRINITY_DN8663_c0_g1~~TRINITY_DN8663_c0_g1_i1.p1  ORF type:complete len:664 (+),score=170.43 TRINITY_DN8663_c0_g1_i1:222-2213(+)
MAARFPTPDVSIKFCEVAKNIRKAQKKRENEVARPRRLDRLKPSSSASFQRKTLEDQADDDGDGFDDDDPRFGSKGSRHQLDWSSSQPAMGRTQTAPAGLAMPLPPLLNHRESKAERLGRQLEWLQAEKAAHREREKMNDMCLNGVNHQLEHALSRMEEAEREILMNQDKVLSTQTAMESIKREMAELQRTGRMPPPGSTGSSQRLLSRGSRGSTATSAAEHKATVVSRSFAPHSTTSSSGVALSEIFEGAAPEAAPAAGTEVSNRSVAEGVESEQGQIGFLEGQAPPGAEGASPTLLDWARGSVDTGAVNRSGGVEQMSPQKLAKSKSSQRLGVSAMQLDVGPRAPLEKQKDFIRKLLLEQNEGSARKAFKRIDLNGSGNLSLGEFAAGLERQGIDWQKITGKKNPGDIFRIFDTDRDGVILFRELFPDQAKHEENPKRVSTPDFWDIWCRKNPHSDFGNKNAKWTPSSPEEELQLLFESKAMMQDGADNRKWISSTFRRLKAKGKTDARARQYVAVHLPAGTGPRDRDGVSTFQQADRSECEKKYKEEVNDHVKNIQKVVFDMKDQRRVVQTLRQQVQAMSKPDAMLASSQSVTEESRTPTFSHIQREEPNPKEQRQRAVAEAGGFIRGHSSEGGFLMDLAHARGNKAEESLLRARVPENF